MNQTSEIDAVQQLLAGHMDAERPGRTDQDDDYTATNEGGQGQGSGTYC
ncbi:hypothetical protein ABZS96_40915 [Streptomyces avermitilis]